MTATFGALAAETVLGAGTPGRAPVTTAAATATARRSERKVVLREVDRGESDGHERVACETRG
jgi:hypothetical protein